MIGLVLLLPLLTPTIWFSLDHKRNASGGVVSGIVTLFSLDHKLYASDYDSDSGSVASENQPLTCIKVGKLKRFKKVSSDLKIILKTDGELAVSKQLRKSKHVSQS